MPNWKKVIVSGSDATLNSLYAANSVTASIFSGSFTGSLAGTASWANNAISSSYALTASFALNGGGGGGGGGAVTYHQTTAAVTWSVNHSLNTYTPIVQVYDEDYNQLVPASVSGSSVNAVQITFSTATAGYAVITTGGLTITGSNAFLFQSTPATTWSFYHGLNETYPVFTIFDSNDDVIVPLKIHADNANTASIYFSTARTGTAVAANCGLSGSTFESASYAATASFVTLAQTASFVTTAQTASYVQNAQTASYVLNAVSTSFASSAAVAILAQTALLAALATTASFSLNAATSSVAVNANFATSSSLAAIAGFAQTASFVTLAQTASYVLNAVSASHADRAISSSYALTSSYASVASASQNAEDIIVYVQNNSGASISKGSVVRISGAVGDNPQIALADWTNDAQSANTLGLVMSTIANGGNGYVMTEGRFIGYDTDTPGWTAGQLLYLGASGSITGSAPTAPLHGVRLGQVLRVQQNNGSIYLRIDNGYEIGELHDVKDTTTTGSYGDLLIKSGSVWINSKQLTGSYGLTGSLQATSFTGSLLGTASFATSASYAFAATSASYAATASYINPITNSYVVLTQVSQSLNFADDTTAAAGGVPLGGLYRNGNFIAIRIV